jgi:protein-disulfide isomerase
MLGGAVMGLAVLLTLALLLSSARAHVSHPVKAPRAEGDVLGPALAPLIGGIPETANVLGKRTAPVTLVYWADLECPICREFVLGALPFVIRRWVRSGDLHIVYASLQTATREPETFMKQQVAAYAAGAQDKAWYFIEIFYHEQGEEDSGYVTERYLDGIARQVHGLNFARWLRARKLGKYSGEVEGDAQAADKLGLTGTPSFQIGRTGGPLKALEVESLVEPESFNRAIERVLTG